VAPAADFRLASDEVGQKVRPPWQPQLRNCGSHSSNFIYAGSFGGFPYSQVHTGASHTTIEAAVLLEIATVFPALKFRLMKPAGGFAPEARRCEPAPFLLIAGRF